MNVGFKTPVTLGSEPVERSLDLRTYLNFLWRNWMFIGALVALSLLVADRLPCSRDSNVYRDGANTARSATGKRYSCGRRLSPFANLQLRDDGKPIIDHQFRSTLAPRCRKGATRRSPANGHTAKRG